MSSHSWCVVSKHPSMNQKIMFSPSKLNQKNSIFNDFYVTRSIQYIAIIITQYVYNPKVISYWLIDCHISPISDIIAIFLYQFDPLAGDPFFDSFGAIWERFCHGFSRFWSSAGPSRGYRCPYIPHYAGICCGI